MDLVEQDAEVKLLRACFLSVQNSLLNISTQNKKNTNAATVFVATQLQMLVREVHTLKMVILERIDKLDKGNTKFQHSMENQVSTLAKHSEKMMSALQHSMINQKSLAKKLEIVRLEEIVIRNSKTITSDNKAEVEMALLPDSPACLKIDIVDMFLKEDRIRPQFQKGDYNPISASQTVILIGSVNERVFYVTKCGNFCFPEKG